MARKKKEKEVENHERWLVSYADFITLLFAFFVVMYATSQSDNEKQAKFEQSFKNAVGMYHVGGTEGILNDPFPSFTKEGSPIENPIRIFHDPRASKRELRDALWQIVYSKLTEEQIKEAGLDIRDDEHGIRISMTTSNLFASGSAKMLPEALSKVDVIGDILRKSERRLVVEGHTDNEAISNEYYPSNWELAAARASTIVRYLIKRHKVPSDLVSVASFADQRPLVKNDSAANKAKNRRIEILITTI